MTKDERGTLFVVEALSFVRYGKDNLGVLVQTFFFHHHFLLTGVGVCSVVECIDSRRDRETKRIGGQAHGRKQKKIKK